MQSKYLIAAYLRGLTLVENAGRYVTIYNVEEYKSSTYFKLLTLNEISLPNSIVLSSEVSDIKQLVEFLENIKQKYSSPLQLAILHSTSFALRISTLVYLIHQNKDIAGSIQDSKVLHKVALVTGSAQGFGKGIADALAKQGAFVYIADLDFEKAKETAEELCVKYFSDIARPLALNCGDEQSVKNSAMLVAKNFGGIDLLISNAGVIVSGDLETIELEDYLKTTTVNYHGYFLMTKYFSLMMKYQYMANKNYFSDIIQINSKSGLQGSNKNSAYAGSKFGSIGLTQSFALELIEYNIKVNAICPGNFYDGSMWSDPQNGLFLQYLKAGKIPGAKTVEEVRAFYEAKTPIKRGCTIEDVVKGLMYLIDQKFEIGQALPISGGQIMLH